MIVMSKINHRRIIAIAIEEIDELLAKEMKAAKDEFEILAALDAWMLRRALIGASGGGCRAIKSTMKRGS